MRDTTDASAIRAAIRRQTLPVRRVPLGQEPDDAIDEIPVAERLAAVWAISRAAWEFAGTPIEPLRRDIVTQVKRAP